MTTWTKPCARVGCDAIVVAKGPKELAKRQFHSLACFYQYRQTTEFPLVAKQTNDQLRRAIEESIRVRRQMAALNAWDRVRANIPQAVWVRLTDDQQKAVQVLGVQLWRHGYTAGRQTGNRLRAQARARLQVAS